MEYIVKNVKDFDLDHIFDCGQCFRWKRQVDGAYIGTAFGKIAKMSLKDGNLIIDNCSEADYKELWHHYLDMDTDYENIKASLAKNDSIIESAIADGEGIRILKQDLWEMIVSFIISQNNHIPRIKKCIENLSKDHGSLIGNYMGEDFYQLPSAEALSLRSIEDLAEVRLGYRAKYLIETGKQVAKYGLPKDYEEVLSLTGVGPKVANCICLFGLGKTDSFPIDVWVKRVMHQFYGLPENDLKGIQNFAKGQFGELGGYAQQYLFYSVRIREQKK